MELSHLRALIAVAEFGTFGKAGVRLNLSAPAVFDQLRKLEAEVSVKLYERMGRRLALTEAGTLLADHARLMLREHDSVFSALQELRAGERGLVRFGCGPHISVSVVPHLFRAFLKSHPNVELRLVTGNDPGLFDMLREGSIDLLMMNLPVDDQAFEQIPLWRYEMVFVLSPDDPAVNDPSQLPSRPFILYQRAYLIEDAIRRFCADAGFQPRLVMYNDQADSIKELVKLGLGISLLPLWSVSEEVRRGNLCIARLPGRRLNRETGLIYRKSRYLPAAMQKLTQVAQDWKNWHPRAEDVSPVC